jgi:hypothetical protein
MPVNYDKEAILQEALKQISEQELTTLSEVETFIPVTRQQMYTEGWADVLDKVKEAILLQRVKRKTQYKRRWADDRAAPVLQLAGFKLIADQDELERLTVNNNNNRQSGELQVTWQENRSFNGSMIEEAQVIPIEQQQQISDNPADTVG